MGGRDVQDLTPELASRKFPMDDNSTAGSERGEETGDQPVYVEERHYEEGAVGRR